MYVYNRIKSPSRPLYRAFCVGLYATNQVLGELVKEDDKHSSFVSSWRSNAQYTHLPPEVYLPERYHHEIRVDEFDHYSE